MNTQFGSLFIYLLTGHPNGKLQKQHKQKDTANRRNGKNSKAQEDTKAHYSAYAEFKIKVITKSNNMLYATDTDILVTTDSWFG